VPPPPQKINKNTPQKNPNNNKITKQWTIKPPQEKPTGDRLLVFSCYTNYFLHRIYYSINVLTWKYQSCEFMLDGAVNRLFYEQLHVRMEWLLSCFIDIHIVVNIERTTKLILIFPAQNVLNNFWLKLKTNLLLSVIIFECKRIIFKRICPLCRDCRLGVMVGMVAESVKGNSFDPLSCQTKRFCCFFAKHTVL
jgi:hypothetical protein